MDNKEQDLKQVYDSFTVAWKFYKRFWEVSESDEYWEAVIVEANALYQKNKTPLNRGLIDAVMQDIERRLKEKHK